MTNNNQIPEGDRTETDAAFEAGLAASKPRPLAEEGDGRFSVVITPNGSTHHVLDREKLEEYGADAPRRKKGTYNVHTAVSFCEFVAKHGDGAEVWADEARQGLVGILNAHGNGPAPAWEDHRVVMELVHTPAWKAWTAIDGKLLEQEAFAEHTESRILDVQTPSGADMVEIVQTFYATTGLTFKSSKILASGERQFIHQEESTASAGQLGEFEIPKALDLGIAPFVGSEPRLITARFRYRILGGRLHLGVVLDRPEDVIAEAFTELVTGVKADLPEGVPVYYGRPSS